MDVPIVIPTYRRHETIASKTLKFLRNCRVPLSRIHLVVADEAEFELYRSSLDPALYGHMHVATVGLAAARKWAASYFDPDVPLMFMDDDILEVFQKSSSGCVSPVRELDQIVKRGFSECSARRIRMWGIYPVLNTMFMRRYLRSGCIFVVGAFYGILNDQSFEPQLEELEDFERCAHQCIHHGGVLRFDDLAVQTKYLAKGGMSASGRAERLQASKAASAHLLHRYPTVFKRVRQKRSGLHNPVFTTANTHKTMLP